MVDEIIITFFAASLLLYVLFGGADFGAGMVELVTPKKLRQQVRSVIFRAIAPVWEANHMWLILAVVILFVGYPAIYADLSTHLHIPLTLVLFGIIGRGCAFTFRHYDAITDGSQKYYSFLFVFSSFWTPFFLGVVAATAGAGTLQPLNGTFYSVYLAPWLSLFSFSVGALMCLLCATLAAAYLIAESENEDQRRFFSKTAIRFNILTLLMAGGVFATAKISQINLPDLFFNNAIALVSIAVCFDSFLVTLWMVRRGHDILVRVTVGAQAVSIILGWFAVRFPVLLRFADGRELTFFNSNAPASTQWVLVFCLLLGSLIIFPFLGYLFFSLKRPGHKWGKK